MAKKEDYYYEDKRVERPSTGANGGFFTSDMWTTGTQQWNPKAGKHIIRILPRTWSNGTRWSHTVYLHWVQGDGYVICPRTKGWQCPYL